MYFSDCFQFGPFFFPFPSKFKHFTFGEKKKTHSRQYRDLGFYRVGKPSRVCSSPKPSG